jgi:hypothetical protein
MLRGLNLLLLLCVYARKDVLSHRSGQCTIKVLFPTQVIELYYTYHYVLSIACPRIVVEACCRAHARLVQR